MRVVLGGRGTNQNNDTVKQAETIVAIREAYGIPFQEGLSLRDYPTLQSVIGFVYTMRPDLKTGLSGDSVTGSAPAAESPSPSGMVPNQPVTQSSDGVAATVLEIVAAKTGYPEDMLELDLDLEGGVTQARIANFLKTSNISFSVWRNEVLVDKD